MMKRICSVLFLMACLAGCEEEEVPLGCNLEETGFEAHIRPIIVNNCAFAGCHSGSRGNGNNFDFTTYSGIKEGIGSFYDRINREPDDPLAMPPDHTLDPCDLYRLNVWILNGAPGY